ncbi:rve-domain-containing protein [Wallemia mellicola]|uniref:Rve-domain-containing protein n=1 Tax=Wallemia mellicola TaxID=1708541 RepID=A0A4T0QTQ0_9BASI|nr:rve-domain-containing protein [Wallemia mellicola]
MEINQNEDVDSKTNTTKTAYSRAEIIKAQKIFNKRNKSLWNKLTLSISTNIFNSIDIDYDTRIANDVYKSICKIFEPEESLEQLQTEFLSRTLIYGENAQKFYTNLKKLFTKLQKLDSIFGENSLKYRALQTIPIELKSSKLHFYQKSQYLNYDELTKAIIKDYNDTIKLDPPAKAASINQVTQIEHVDKYDDQNTSKNQSQTTDLLRRLDIKFCSYCLENNYRLPRTHSDNECGHLHPQLKDKHKRSLGHLTPDVALYDQGSDITYTCRRDLLTNVRQLATPCYFDTPKGKVKSTTVGTMNVNLEYKNGTINWVDTEAHYNPHFSSTLIPQNLLIKNNLGLDCQPPHNAIFYHRHNRETAHNVPYTNGKLLFTISVNQINNLPKYIFSVTRMKQISLSQWHSRIAHLHEQATRNTLKRLYNITFPRSQKINCDSCKMNKTNQPPFDGKLNKAKGPLDILHSDLMNIPTNTDEKYALVIIDEYTRYSWTFPLKHKHNIFDIITNLHTEIERQTGYKVKRIHSDRAKEFMSDRLLKYYKTHGIINGHTAGYAASSNGIAERYNQTIQRGIATLLTDAKLPNEYWIYAMNYYTHIKNSSPHSSIATTPIEELFDTLPSLHRLKPFGCRAYIQHPSIETNKVSPMRSPGIFLGFDKSSNGAIIQLNDNVLISRNVYYNESEFPGINNIDTVHSANHSFKYRSPLSSSHDDPDEPTDNEIEEEESSNETQSTSQDDIDIHGQEESSNETPSIPQDDINIHDQEEPQYSAPPTPHNELDTHEQDESSNEALPSTQDDIDMQEQVSSDETPSNSQGDISVQEQEKPPHAETEESEGGIPNVTHSSSHSEIVDDRSSSHENFTSLHNKVKKSEEGQRDRTPPNIPHHIELPTHETTSFIEPIHECVTDTREKIAHQNDQINATGPAYNSTETFIPMDTERNTDTDKTKSIIPIPAKTIYDRFDKQEESPNEYLGFNHSFKRKVHPTIAKGTPIQPGQARHAARIAKQQEDDRRNKTKDAKEDIHYERLQEQWLHFDNDKKMSYPDPDSLLHKTINKLLHVDHTLAAKAEPNKKLRHAYALARQQVTTGIPNTFKQAMTHPDAIKWRQGMEEEMATHDRNNTWTLIDLKDVPKNNNIVGSRWVYNIKTNAMNEPIKWKARLVAQGFSQKPGIDYEETYAPVTSLRIIRLLIAIAVEENLQIHQMDVTGAYLYGDIDQPIYMKLPPGMYENEKDKKICKLNKALYGLRQSGRIWYELLNKVLEQMGFKSSYSEPCLYHSEQLDAIISVYVDDLIILTRTTTTANKIKSKLKVEFEMKDLGNINHILGMKVDYDQEKGTATIDQSGYIAKAIEDLNLQSIKRKSIPMSTNLTLSNEDSPKIEDHIDEMKTKPYAQAIGKLNWIAQASRPDIAFATSMCGRYTQNPGIKHWNAVRQIYGYLKNTIDTKIEFKKQMKPLNGYCKGVILQKDIKGHVDADYAGCWDTARSTSGCVFTYSGGAIAWTSKRQKCVATSTGEAEYMAIKHGSDIAIWLRNVMEHLGRNLESPIPVKTDNTAALTNILNPGSITGLKHIRVQYHAGKERHERKEIEVKGIRTHDQLADIFTKALNGNQLRLLCKRMGINISNSNIVEDRSIINDSQYTQQEECQNTDTGLNIQHHLVTKDRRNKELHQEPRGTPRRSRGRQGT